ncbi:MAG: Asp-tRNA(Asn)/Glu-tRNA(Gln) amidotransferase subunit GatB [Planctomycetes bacterium]|nr:Asp-tRNA(Asn)/Glu-tRNA(Gln) amidotransferase subunit GatB [Planctomycetota bacterium]
MTATDFEPVIGLEIHAELQTRSKMFCGCPVLDPLVSEPNVAVCPVCVGLPGALPVANRRAVELGISVGLALNCQIRDFLAFARKNYFYPDLPKGYQISQHEYPIAFNGHIDVPGPTGRVRIRRAHLEEDTAKLVHASDGTTLVDFNRSSVPLFEIVTEPDIHSAEGAMAYASAVRDVLRYLGANSGDMEKGVLRLEANVSVRERGTTDLNTRTEIKNLNSFSSLGRGIELEVQRQIALILSGGKVRQATMGWEQAENDRDRVKLVEQRIKENADDYRYFPEPDLRPVPVSREWVARLRLELPELPTARADRFRTAFGLSAADAELLTADRALGDYFEAVVRGVSTPKVAANWMLGEFMRLLNEGGGELSSVKVTADALAELIREVEQGNVTPSSAKSVLADMFASGERAPAVIARRGLTTLRGADALTPVAEKIVTDNPAQVAQYFAGKENVFQWLVGQIMKATKGQADAQQTRTTLQAVLEARRPK